MYDNAADERRRKILKVAAVAPLAIGGAVNNGWSQSTVKQNTKAIPSSGEHVAVIGMGTARIFSDSSDAEQLLAVMQTFFGHGGQVIDTSPMYGAAESIIGDNLATMDKTAALFAATKVFTSGEQNGIEQMRESMRKMRVQVMDLMQIHNLRDWQTHMKTLRRWKDEGRFRYIGITTSGGRRHDEFMEIMRREPIDFVQFTYNIGSRNVEQTILPLAEEKGIATMINVPYGRGRLFRVVGDSPLPDWAGEIDCTSWGQFFLKFITSHPAVTCVIPATTKVNHMADNMQGGIGRQPGSVLRKEMVRYFQSIT